MNEEGWKLNAYEELGFEPLDDTMLEQIRGEEAARVKRNKDRREPAALKAKRHKPWERKAVQRKETTDAARTKQLGPVNPKPRDIYSGSEDAASDN
jgi:hypothetical protein